MTTKAEGGGGKTLVVGPLKKNPFFAASPRHKVLNSWSALAWWGRRWDGCIVNQIISLAFRFVWFFNTSTKSIHMNQYAGLRDQEAHTASGVSNLSRLDNGMSLLVLCWTLDCRCWFRTRNLSKDIPVPTRNIYMTLSC